MTKDARTFKAEDDINLSKILLQQYNSTQEKLFESIGTEDFNEAVIVEAYDVTRNLYTGNVINTQEFEEKVIALAELPAVAGMKTFDHLGCEQDKSISQTIKDAAVIEILLGTKKTIRKGNPKKVDLFYFQQSFQQAVGGNLISRRDAHNAVNLIESIVITDEAIKGHRDTMAEECNQLLSVKAPYKLPELNTMSFAEAQKRAKKSDDGVDYPKANPAQILNAISQKAPTGHTPALIAEIGRRAQTGDLKPKEAYKCIIVVTQTPVCAEAQKEKEKALIHFSSVISDIAQKATTSIAADPMHLIAAATVGKITNNEHRHLTPQEQREVKFALRHSTPGQA
ncbi:MAG: hypothetical protein JWM96_248 [Alphaproteobacteria bacterium]|nr:hypothetical protein [Alphaproteobacteria bacterium]